MISISRVLPFLGKFSHQTDMILDKNHFDVSLQNPRSTEIGRGVFSDYDWPGRLAGGVG